MNVNSMQCIDTFTMLIREDGEGGRGGDSINFTNGLLMTYIYG